MKIKPNLSALAFISSLLLLVSSCAKPRLIEEIRIQPPGPDIIPKPLRFERLIGAFVLDASVRLIVPRGDREIETTARFLAERLRSAFGLELEVTDTPPGEVRPSLNFRRSERADLGTEGYVISISPAAVDIEGQGSAGLFYGVQTLLQLLPPEAFGSLRKAEGPLRIPCCRIEDQPRFPWRGQLLDVSRHFFPKDFIKTVIDGLAVHKMNTFHWHLTDDQGWRLEILKYPLLTEVGAWRVDRENRPWNDRPDQQPGEKATYGGFYTQNDVREILAYAASRHVTVIPEIEMPGHCLAALAAYPRLSCSGGPFTVPPGGVWPIKDVYCPGNEETFKFLEDVLTEVIELFPGEYIHIGGDEVDKSTWKSCPKCQARMKAEGLATEEELQSWFIRRIERFLNSKGKKLMGWDEILEGGLAPKAAVMSWRGTAGGIAAARAGHPVVMTPTSHCYFDYYQGDPAVEPLAIGGDLPLRKVTAFEPVPAELTADESALILGAQANLWTEYIPAPGHAQYMTFPRLAAMAEAGWTAREARNGDEFIKRLETQFRRYEAMGLKYARSIYSVDIIPSFNAGTKEWLVRMENESDHPLIRYTLDGTTPTVRSKAYEGPIPLRKTAIVKAGVFSGTGLRGSVAETRILTHLALGRTPDLRFPYQARYDGGGPTALVDGLRGGKNQADGRWQGFEGDDLVAAIDLGRRRRLHEVEVGFLRKTGSWIFFPQSVEVAVSNDGKDYRLVGTAAGPPPGEDGAVSIKSVRISAGGNRARFVRVTAASVRTCPEGHPGAGRKAWLFADEIVVR